ncbi:predicted protein [Postia placenta Mad-698-R]|nr:predicted protein [Postia placenta Mad-698-R]
MAAPMKALVVQEDKTVAVLDHPVPAVGDDDILVRTVAVAQNPTDWKFVDHVTRAGTILGCDFSGYVVQAGKNVASPAVGDHVAGFVQGGTFVDSGAYAEYIRTPAELAWVVPQGTLSHEEAATFGCAFWTAVQALFHPARLGLVAPPLKVDAPEWVFVYGGSSSVGQFAIQLLHLAGYQVATTASPHNHALVRALGADVVVDHSAGAEAIAALKAATGDTVTAALDAISRRDSQEFAARVLGPRGGKVILLLQPNPEARVREDVVFQHTLIYTALGREFALATLFPVSAADYAHMTAFLRTVPALVQTGALRPNPVRLWPGGLAAVPDGLQFMREGRVSGEKIVYRVAA